jgi:hypothetical protein
MKSPASFWKMHREDPEAAIFYLRASVELSQARFTHYQANADLERQLAHDLEATLVEALALQAANGVPTQ